MGTEADFGRVAGYLAKMLDQCGLTIADGIADFDPIVRRFVQFAAAGNWRSRLLQLLEIDRPREEEE